MYKILHINTSKKGGAGRIASNLSKSLNQGSILKSYFAFGRGLVSDQNNEYKFTLLPEIYLHALITRITGLEGYGTSLSTKQLIKYIGKQNFDIIHLHNIHGYYLNFILLLEYIKSKDIPVVWTLHDCWSITGSCAYSFDCKKYISGCGDCKNISTYPKNYIDNSYYMWNKKREYFSKSFDLTVVTPSQWLADIIENSLLKHHKIEVIPNGIDVGVFKPYEKTNARSEMGIPKDHRVVIFIAADLNDERKGAKDFFNAVNSLSEVENMTVVTAGEKIKDNFNYDCNLLEFGYIADKNILAKLYNAADVFCITSIDEIFGLTVTEAMACGTPVVGYKVGGIPEQVSDDCGILVTPKDVKGLAEALKVVLLDDDIKNSLRKNCRDKVLKNFSVSTMTKGYIKLYSDILKSNADN